MFTGIIESIAKIQSSESKGNSLYLSIELPENWEIKAGDSIATNGVCLTVKEVKQGLWRTELMLETLSKTTFGQAIPNQVNLERAMLAGGRLDGHFVLGHVDSTGEIIGKEKKGESLEIIIKYSLEFSALVVSKGSITVDGISFTVVDVKDDWFSINLVGYTIEHTTLAQKKTGEKVNLEFDILAKYITKYVSTSSKGNL
ncbi:MAG: riboflavin synthase [Patescibacteria group bacterium]